MNDDLHICGTCKTGFIVLDHFLSHKQSCGSSKLASKESSSGKTNSIQDNRIHSLNTREKPFKCPMPSCEFSCQYAKDLIRHNRRHTGDKPFTCITCGRNFSRADKLKQHEYTHNAFKPLSCTLCSYSTTDNDSLKKHLRTHSEEKSFRCKQCNFASRFSSHLFVHQRKHSGIYPYTCPICSRKFRVKSDLTRHKRTHTGDKPYACSKCFYRSSVRSNLTTHIRLHHDESSCNKIQSQQSSISKTNSPTNTQSNLDRYSLNSFCCDFCSFQSKLPGVVKTHMERIHSDLPPSEVQLDESHSMPQLRGEDPNSKTIEDLVPLAHDQIFSKSPLQSPESLDFSESWLTGPVSELGLSSTYTLIPIQPLDPNIQYILQSDALLSPN